MEEVLVEFVWHPGFSKTQALKNIHALHESAARHGLSPLLEISSKSPELLGQQLSALTLTFEHRGRRMSVESAFQGSKVFDQGGPLQQLYDLPGREARAYPALRTSGSVVGFRLFDLDLPTNPVTAFYDWLYLQALEQNPEKAAQLSRYRGFTDIAFNPARSLNCQARAAALYVAIGSAAHLDTWPSYFAVVSQLSTGGADY